MSTSGGLIFGKFWVKPISAQEIASRWGKCYHGCTLVISLAIRITAARVAPLDAHNPGFF
jgi:hypothetical protein